MSSADYAACRYSVTLKTDDLAVLHMLRGLTQHCYSGRLPQISWGGTTAKSWRLSDGRATFRFSTSADRSQFLREAERLLPAGTWKLEGTDDNDPASPQRK
ncbi:hypothetical protein GCM10023176_05190 [Micromonospora coerulea]|uniref:Uncharacterized protein n=1 Tax=Micromonospora coerulea TaxID=47856 RepID=A0ABP8S6Z5_9ACTN